MEEVGHWEWALMFEKHRPGSVYGSLTTDHDVAVSYLASTCLYASLLPAMLVINWPSETVNQDPVQCIPFMSCLGHGVSLQQ